MKRLVSFAILTVLASLFAIAALTTPAQAEKPAPIACYYFCDEEKDHFMRCCEFEQDGVVVLRCRNTGSCIPILP